VVANGGRPCADNPKVRAGEENMRILVVEHHDKPTIGMIGETLHDLGVEIRTVWGMHGEELPRSHREHDGIIVLGGTMAALEDEICPYFPPLLRLIREFSEAGKPVLGVCLGAQLIARSFDADLHISGELEFGFHIVSPTATAADDPVLGHLDAPLPLFQWHTDHYTLPAGAERLATGESYENQAYRIGRAVYGMQFHFEVTQSLVQRYVDGMPDIEEQLPGHRDWLPAQFAAHEKPSIAFCRTLTRCWVELA
jgi:GMP synthase-like glutamine amidotransferase